MTVSTGCRGFWLTWTPAFALEEEDVFFRVTWTDSSTGRVPWMDSTKETSYCVPAVGTECEPYILTLQAENNFEGGEILRKERLAPTRKETYH